MIRPPDWLELLPVAARIYSPCLWFFDLVKPPRAFLPFAILIFAKKETGLMRTVLLDPYVVGGGGKRGRNPCKHKENKAGIRNSIRQHDHSF
jgi:hypothetical protein